MQRENTTKQSMDTDREFVVVVEKIPVFNSNFHKTAFTKNCHFFLTHTSCLKIKIKNVHSTWWLYLLLSFDVVIALGVRLPLTFNTCGLPKGAFLLQHVQLLFSDGSDSLRVWLAILFPFNLGQLLPILLPVSPFWSRMTSGWFFCGTFFFAPEKSQVFLVVPFSLLPYFPFHFH